MSEPNPIRNVSDTALWVAVYRAMETERSDALFHDPYARRLAGERGQAIVDAMPRGKSMSWPMVVRTASWTRSSCAACSRARAPCSTSPPASMRARIG